VFLDRNHSKTW